QERVLADIGQLLRAGDHEAKAKLEKLLAQQRELERRIAELQAKLAGGATRRPLDVRTVDGANVIATRIEGLDDEGARPPAHRLREQYKPGGVLVGRAAPQGPPLVAPVSQDPPRRV